MITKADEQQLLKHLSHYRFDNLPLEIQTFGTGLINHTWKVTAGSNTYIFQRINETVFTQPPDIDDNIRLLSTHLQQVHPGYFFVAPVEMMDGQTLLFAPPHGYFRLFPFVDGSHSIDVVKTPEQAYEAATQFGRFTRLLKGVDVKRVKITIPRFHDLSLRYGQFSTALKNGNKSRIKGSLDSINKLNGYDRIVKEFEHIRQSINWKQRVTHHDTKISNVLFNQQDKGICVIDLDTVMPGFFISDVGDMMRTYLSPVSEEENDFTKIEVRDLFYKAIVEGYYNEMKWELTTEEQGYFFYAGKFMIYMQALRFLTDHLNDDVYYGAAYPGHNFVRANNQLVLLERLIEKESLLS